MSEDLRVPLDQINSLNNTPEQVNPVPANPAPPNAEVVIDMTADRDLPENPRDSALSADGSETVVFKQDIPESSDVVAMRTLIRIASSAITSVMLAYFIFGYLILDVYESRVPDFKKIFWLTSVIFTIKIIVHLVMAISQSPNPKSVLRSMADSITDLFVVQVFMLYLSGELPAQTFEGCLYTNFALQFLKMFIFGIKQHCPNYTSAVLESITVMFTGLKLVNPTQYGSWSTILLYYIVIYYILLFTMIVAGIVVFSVTMAFIFQRNDALNRITFETFLYFNIAWILIFGFAFCGSQIYYGIYSLLIQNAIVPNPGPIASMPYEFYLAGNLMMCLAIFTTLLVVIVNTCLMNRIFRRMKPMQGKEISLKTYAKAFVLELKKISGNYFKRSQEVEVPTSVIKLEVSEAPLDECVVCQTLPSSFLLFPCNHCVLCVECVKPFLESQSICPICKEPIQKCSHISFDEGKKTYLVDFSYKLKNY